MSALTSPDNIYYLTTAPTDPASMVAESAMQATSIQAALAKRQAITYRWATVTQRNAQTGMNADDIGYQVDVDTEYRYTVGGVWQVWNKPWVAFTPAYTNLTVGTTGAVNTGGWSVSSGVATVDFDTTLGTGFAVASGANVTLPIAMRTAGRVANRSIVGQAIYYDVSATTLFAGSLIFLSGGTAIGLFTTTSAAPPVVIATVQSNRPMAAWGAGDEIHGTLTYQVA